MDSEPRSAMLRALSHRFSEVSEPVAIAGEFVLVLEDIRIVLTPILGARGVTALMQRCVHLARHEHPALPPPVAEEAILDVPAVQAALAAEDAAAARAAVDGALRCFHDLLTSLIGVPLTERLFESVWTSPSSGKAAQEPKP